MANLIKSHSFKVKKANGIDDFQIQLRAAYWNRITSEKKLRKALENSIEQKKINDPAYSAALQNHYSKNDILFILRDFGMIAGSERLTKNA